MHKLAIVGNPVAHSLSPLIFSLFAQQSGIALEYQKLCSPIDRFEEQVTSFFASGGLALNITAPFKARAYAMADKHKANSSLAQTANVLIAQDGYLTADNTDGIGLVADLAHSGFDLAAKNVLILGSGSVVSSVLASLEAAKPQRIDLLMRNSAKLEEFSLKSAKIDEFSQQLSYDLVINTTPNTLDNQLFKQVQRLSSGAFIYDMIYTAGQTYFMQELLRHSPQAQAMNGLGMLIQQAKYGFHSIFGSYPDVEPLYPQLRELLNKH